MRMVMVKVKGKVRKENAKKDKINRKNYEEG